MEVDCDCYIINNDNFCPNPNIEGCKGHMRMNSLVAAYPEMLGCEGETKIICCLLLSLLANEGPTPDAVIVGAAPAVPRRVDAIQQKC